MNSGQESAWLAGLLEGEGCFFVYTGPHNKRAQLRVQLKMSDRDIVERAVGLMAIGGSITEHNPNGSPGQILSADTAKNPAAWSVTYGACWIGQKAENLMRRILPYMGDRRTSKIEECLSTPNLSHHSREA